MVDKAVDKLWFIVRMGSCFYGILTLAILLDYYDMETSRTAPSKTPSDPKQSNTLLFTS